ncbi:uba ts-n domain-containing protein [Cyclospora cayetanensis]|uniref:Uba ts-n domain-containing protein n=1 Tax=Cyclospora cayetanensis TaxID=88456 RepID=A0A1D3CXC7_9EIME|nr:uba ts-n domain-containing protein [Cyclospora cayetanensis]
MMEQLALKAQCRQEQEQRGQWRLSAQLRGGKKKAQFQQHVQQELRLPFTPWAACSLLVHVAASEDVVLLDRFGEAAAGLGTALDEVLGAITNASGATSDSLGAQKLPPWKPVAPEVAAEETRKRARQRPMDVSDLQHPLVQVLRHAAPYDSTLQQQAVQQLLLDRMLCALQRLLTLKQRWRMRGYWPFAEQRQSVAATHPPASSGEQADQWRRAEDGTKISAATANGISASLPHFGYCTRTAGLYTCSASSSVSAS